MVSFDLKVHGNIAYELRDQRTVGSEWEAVSGSDKEVWFQPWHVQAEERPFQLQRTVDQLSVTRGTHNLSYGLGSDC